MKDRLNILVQSSDFYCPFSGVMLTSLFENNKDIPVIKVYYLCGELSEENVKKLNELSQKYGREIVFINLKKIDEKLENLKVEKFRNSYIPYYKIFANSFVDDDIEQILYLDSDIIIDGSLAPLIGFDLEGNVLGMCYDVMSEKYKKILGIDDGRYFNTGVILFDRKKWIGEKCEDEIVRHITTVRAKYTVAEQDIMSILFRNRTKVLSLRYNFVSDLLLYRDVDWVKSIYGIEEYYDAEEFNSSLQHPVVNHCFAAISKRPWYKDSGHILSDLWQKYQRMSPWDGSIYLEGKLPFKRKINLVLYKCLPRKAYAFANRNLTDFLIYMRAKKTKQI